VLLVFSEAVDSVQNFIHDSVVRAFFFWKEKVAGFAKKKLTIRPS
jgi:hypothetical protein